MASSWSLLGSASGLGRRARRQRRSQVVHACISNASLTVRIVGVSGACVSSPASKAETPTHWAVVGPAGATGPTGPAGPQGPSGVTPLTGFLCTPGKALIGFDGTTQPVCDTVSSAGPLDSDADGVPDALDSCPSVPNLLYNGGSYCPVAIYDIRLGTVGAGATVSISNAFVDAVSGSTVTLSVQPDDPGYLGPDNGSLEIQIGALAAPPVFSRVNVLGLVTPGPGFTAAAVVLVVGSN